MDVFGLFVGAVSAPGGVAKDVLVGPLRIGDFADDGGPDPVGVAGVFAGDAVAGGERSPVLLEWGEPAPKVCEGAGGEAGADLPGVPKPVVVLHTEEEGALMAPVRRTWLSDRGAVVRPHVEVFAKPTIVDSGANSSLAGPREASGAAVGDASVEPSRLEIDNGAR